LSLDIAQQNNMRIADVVRVYFRTWTAPRQLLSAPHLSLQL